LNDISSLVRIKIKYNNLRRDSNVDNYAENMQIIIITVCLQTIIVKGKSLLQSDARLFEWCSTALQQISQFVATARKPAQEAEDEIVRKVFSMGLDLFIVT